MKYLINSIVTLVIVALAGAVVLTCRQNSRLVTSEADLSSEVARLTNLHQADQLSLTSAQQKLVDCEQNKQITVNGLESQLEQLALERDAIASQYAQLKIEAERSQPSTGGTTPIPGEPKPARSTEPTFVQKEIQKMKEIQAAKVAAHEVEQRKLTEQKIINLKNQVEAWELRMSALELEWKESDKKEKGIRVSKADRSRQRSKVSQSITITKRQITALESSLK